MTPLPILYSFRRCPYAIRARLAVMSSGTPVALREILLRDKPQAFLEASPSATVPTLVMDGQPVIDESLDIMLWALRGSDPEGWLAPPNGSMDEMMSLIETNDGPFKTRLDRYKYHVRHVDCDPVEERQAALDLLEPLERRLGESDWLFGPSASLADMAILPFVRQFANVDRSWFDGLEQSGLQRWLSRFETSERFLHVMDKYPPWKPGDPVTEFGKATLEA